ncbi:MAG: type II toxin-antitoxin system RelE/ParE family toxin [Alphaproteobacteria bacterium]|nr:type II toxin-antitoxin system RelE/ParE family toxin [Alphaproteobacteria bacterium]
MWSIVFVKSALKALNIMPRHLALTIRANLDRLAADPLAPNNNVAALRGRSGYRLRVGDWRVIYRLDGDRLTILVIEIGHRREIYR